jgi:hypothetical protein
VVLCIIAVAASAAALDVDQKHVFEGEQFTVKYTASAPLSQQAVSIAFAGQAKTITLPSMTVGTFSDHVTFEAPARGDYEVVAGEARAPVTVEPALVQLTDVFISPQAIAPRETAKLAYTIENVGELKAYNVKSRLDIVSSERFVYSGEEQELFSVMSPGEKIVQSKDIKARENAAGETNIAVTVTYEFDSETHTLQKIVRLGVNTMDITMVIAAVVAVILVVGFLFSRAEAKSAGKGKGE